MLITRFLLFLDTMLSVNLFPAIKDEAGFIDLKVNYRPTHLTHEFCKAIEIITLHRCEDTIQCRCEGRMFMRFLYARYAVDRMN